MSTPSKIKLVLKSERGFPPVTGKVADPKAIIKALANTVLAQLEVEIRNSTEAGEYTFKVFVPVDGDEVIRVKRAVGQEPRAMADNAIRKALPTTLHRRFRYFYATYKAVEKGYEFPFVIYANS